MPRGVLSALTVADYKVREREMRDEEARIRSAMRPILFVDAAGVSADLTSTIACSTRMCCVLIFENYATEYGFSWHVTNKKVNIIISRLK